MPPKSKKSKADPPKVHDPNFLMIKDQFESGIDNIRSDNVYSTNIESTENCAVLFSHVVTKNFHDGFEYLRIIKRILIEKAIKPLSIFLNQVSDDSLEFANSFYTEYQKFTSILSLSRAIFRTGFDNSPLSRSGEKHYDEHISEIINEMKLNETYTKNNGSSLLEITLQNCNSYRNGNVVSLPNIKSIIRFILMIGHGMDGVSQMQGNSTARRVRSNRTSKEGTQEDVTRGDFIKHFLKPFRNQTMSYYKSKANMITCEGGSKMLDYLRWVEEQLQREGELLMAINLYPLFKEHVTGMKTANTYYDELVVILLDTNRDKILGDVSHGFGALMEKEDILNAGLMYRMMEIIPNNTGIISMHEYYQRYCEEHFKKILIETAPDGKVLMKTTDEVMKFFYRQIITCKRSFNKAEKMKESLYVATKMCINTNTLKEIFPRSLAHFAALLMKRDYDVGNDETSWIDALIMMFYCVNQKDVFQEEYQNMLANRLLDSKNTHTDLERSFLSRLNKAQGQHYIQKMESMITDCESSKTQTENFMREVRKSDKLKGVSFSVKVLTAAQWPSYHSDDIRAEALSPSLKECMDEFAKFYANSNSANNSRILDWKHKLGSGQATIAFPLGLKEVTGSVYQLVLLLLISDNGDMTIQQLNERLGRSKSDMRLTMSTLASVSNHREFKMVERVNEQGKPTGSNAMKVGDFVRLSRTFKHQSRKFKICAEQTKAEAPNTKNAELSKIENERKLRVQTTLIKIMKSRKIIEFRILIELASTQLATSFKVDNSFLKAEVENLITSKYLKRSDDDQKMLEYIS